MCATANYRAIRQIFTLDNFIHRKQIKLNNNQKQKKKKIDEVKNNQKTKALLYIQIKTLPAEHQ